MVQVKKKIKNKVESGNEISSSFQDLEIRAVLLDEILREPDSPSPDYVLDLEVKSLRDTRDLLEKVGLKVTVL